MEFEQSVTRGWYDSSFLHLRVETSRPIFDLTKLLYSTDPEDRKVLSTFFHEYLHFLQEVTTVSGAYRIGLMIDFLKEANNNIKEPGNSTFKVPVKFGNTFNAAANRILMEIYRGSGEAQWAYYQNYKTEICPVLDRDGNLIRVPVYTVYYKTEGMALKKFKFGHECLKEFVTHTLQERFCPGMEHPDIPYAIAGEIIEKECPSFGKDEMHYVALCDACLMDIHPARCFFNTIERIRKSGFTPINCEEVYRFVYSELRFLHGTTEYSLEGTYKRGAEYTKRQLAAALNSDFFTTTREWITYIFEQAESIRFKKPAFMTELVEGPGKFSHQFFELFGKLGTPFFTDESFNGAFVPPAAKPFNGVQAYQLLAFREIHKVFEGQKCCGLINFCKKASEEDITNENCRTAPWLRGIGDGLCPLGVLWKTWGLNGMHPSHA